MIAVRAEATATAEERERFEAVSRARYGELYALSFRLPRLMLEADWLGRAARSR